MAGKEVRRIALVQIVHETVVRPPGLAAGALKAYINHHRPNEYEIDLFESNDFQRNEINDVGRYDLIGLSSVSLLYSSARKIARTIKDQPGRRPLVVLGGSHVTSLPSSLTDEFDYAVIGEGEETFLQLLDALNAGQTDESILALPGLCGIRDTTLVRGLPRPLIDSLDTLPFADRQMFNKYHAAPSIFTARGCPFDCDFCTGKVLWTRRVRKLSPKRVIDELAFMSRTIDDMKIVFFRDDIAFLSPSYTRALLDHARRDYPEIIPLPKIAHGHAQVLTPTLVKLLKEFGIRLLLLGFESGSDRILSILKSNTVTVEQNQRAIDVCNDLGLRIGGNFIVGTPDEREEDLIATYEFIIRNLSAGKLDSVSTTLLTPFPGQRYWDMFMATGVDLERFDWSRLDEPGFSTFLQNNRGRATVRDWWHHREERRNIYLGALPKDRFVSVLERYEPRIIELLAENEANRKKQRESTRGHNPVSV